MITRLCITVLLLLFPRHHTRPNRCRRNLASLATYLKGLGEPIAPVSRRSPYFPSTYCGFSSRSHRVCPSNHSNQNQKFPFSSTDHHLGFLSSSCKMFHIAFQDDVNNYRWVTNLKEPISSGWLREISQQYLSADADASKLQTSSRISIPLSWPPAQGALGY